MFKKTMQTMCGILFAVATVAFSGVDGDCGTACLFVGTVAIFASAVAAHYGGVYGKNDTD